MQESNKLEKIISLCKRRGFLYQGSEIYGGLAGTWDYGPFGLMLKNNKKNSSGSYKQRKYGNWQTGIAERMSRMRKICNMVARKQVQYDVQDQHWPNGRQKFRIISSAGNRAGNVC